MKGILLAALVPAALIAGEVWSIMASENPYVISGMSEAPDYSVGVFRVFIPSLIVAYPFGLLVALAAWLLYFSIFIDPPWREPRTPPSSADQVDR